MNLSLQPEVSIIICTLDRVACLATCFKSLAWQDGIFSSEIIVVNDGSTELCLRLIDDWVIKLPVVYVRAGFRSLGRARNIGFEHARAPIVAYLDDDATVSGDWLTSLRVDFPALDSGYVGQTGPVYPNGDIDFARDWLHPGVARQLCSLQPDRASSSELHFPECMIGCNMAFKRDFLLHCGGFSTKIQNYDEAYVIWPAMHRGHHFYFNRRMRAAHQVDQSRLSLKYLVKKYRGQGAAYQHLLTMLSRQGFGPSPWNICWSWLRPLCGWCIARLIGHKHWQCVFWAELCFWHGRIRSFFSDFGDYYETTPVDPPTL